MESPFLKAVRERVVIYDGAMGSLIQEMSPSLDDFWGKENCSEVLNLSRPEMIRDIHAQYLRVGADVVETNTFGATKIVLGVPSVVVFTMLCIAAFCCCMPMSMPQIHLVALCSDLGIKPAHGAAMLSVLLGTAFISRQVWGAISDRIGGLMTVLIGSAWQFCSIAALTVTKDEIGLFTVTAIFGLGFSGIIPAYVLAVRELFPAHQAG